jgi:hypothetical protein
MPKRWAAPRTCDNEYAHMQYEIIATRLRVTISKVLWMKTIMSMFKNHTKRTID